MNNKIIINESQLLNIIKNSIMAVMENLSRDEDIDYTHYVVNSETGYAICGYDYSDIPNEELMNNEYEYFFQDCRDYGYNPDYLKVITREEADKNGGIIWSSTGMFPFDEERYMRDEYKFVSEKDPWVIAIDQHPEWYID